MPTTPSHCCDHPCTQTPRRRRLDAVVDLAYTLFLVALGFVLCVVVTGGHVCSEEVSMLGVVVRGDVVGIAGQFRGVVVGLVGSVVNTLRG